MLGPMYTKLGRKNKRKLTKLNDTMFLQMSDEGQETYNKMDSKFKSNLDKSLNKLKGSIFYIQKGHFNFKYNKDA